MTPSNQFTFIYGLPSSRSRRAHELQRSKARSHAAIVAHQRLRSRISPKHHNGSSVEPATSGRGQAVIPFRTLRLTPQVAPEDRSHDISSSTPSPNTISSAPSPNTISSAPSPNTVSSTPSPNTVSSTPSPNTVSSTPSPNTVSSTPSPNTVSSTRGPLGHLQPPHTVDCYLSDDDGDHSEQEEGDIEYTIDTSLAVASFQHSSSTTQPLFKISLAHEGFSGLRTDPFSCIPTGGDRRIERTIDFVSQVIGFGNDTVCYIFDVSNVYASFLETLRDEHFFDAGLGVVQFLREQVRIPGSQPSTQTLKHRGNAIVKILNKLSRPDSTVDDITIFGMIFLAALEKGLRNPEAHNLHKRNIAKIISQRGGLKQLQNGSVLKGYLMHYDTFWAMETGETMFPGQRRLYEQRYPTHPFSAELRAFITTLPSGFQQLVTECALCFDILPILSRATHLTRLNLHNRSELISKTRRLTKHYDDFWEACPCLGISDNLYPMLEKLLSLTLICYSFTAFGSNYYPTAFRGSRFAITKRIALYSPKSKAEEDCLIWMWIIAIDCWRIDSRLHPDGLSLLFNLQSRFSALRRVSAVAAVARRFLWPSDIRKPVYLYWEDLIKPS